MPTKPNFFLKLFVAFVVASLLVQSVEARLLLYIDLSTTDGIDIIMIDGKVQGDAITSQDTDDPRFLTEPTKYVTVTDSNGPGTIGVDDAGLARINSILSIEGYSITSRNFTAYSTSAPGPAEIGSATSGGEKLDLKIYLDRNISLSTGGINGTGMDPSAKITIGATRTLSFPGPGWFYENYASGNAIAGNQDNDSLIGNMYFEGGLSTAPQDFDLSGAYTNKGVPDVIDSETGLYSFNPGTTTFSGTVVGNLTMSLLFQATLGNLDELDYQGSIFATVPEPLSLGTWLVVGLGSVVGARQRRRR